ncbi:MAG: ABC transporter permease [Betaproteobacteria bacterium]
MSKTTAAPAATEIRLAGPLTHRTVGALWRETTRRLDGKTGGALRIDASAVTQADDSGIALLFELARLWPQRNGATVELVGLDARLQRLLDGFDARDFAARQTPEQQPGLVESLGRTAAANWADARALIEFLGQATAVLAATLLRPARIRWRTVLAVAEEAGANAVGITLLVGFLMGVIIAFQIAVVAQQFGAVIFVVNGVTIAMLRELGPLMTAIIFAGRSGAAFAAEIGTQKVNEEVNALVTFGLEPVSYLVVPRLLAGLLVLPLLAVLADLIGLFGGALVMLRFDIGFLEFYSQMLSAASMTDVFIGLIKAAVFGLVIAGVGCYRGLSTGLGAASVGLSATRAVVTSIVLIVVIDGLFAVLINRLGF